MMPRSSVLSLCACLALFLVVNLLHAQPPHWSDTLAQDLLRDLTAATTELEQQRQQQEQTTRQARQELQELNAHIKRCRDELAQRQETLRQLKQQQHELHAALQQQTALQKQLQQLTPHGWENELPQLAARANASLTPQLVPTQATTSDGTILPGTSYALGPFAAFKPADPTLPLALLAPPAPGLLLPTLYPHLTPPQQAELQKLFSGHPAALPCDPTLGHVLKAPPPDTFLVHLQKGGPVMIPLAVLALTALLAILGKAWTTRRLPARAPTPEQVRQALQPEAATTLHPLLQPLVHLARQAPAALSKDDLEEQLYLDTLRLNAKLEHFLPLIAVCASTAPLLGLLGTVTGMIQTFSLITRHGAGDASALASGIAEALITTETGLATAIPALLAHTFLARRLKRFKTIQQQTALLILDCQRPAQPDTPA